MNTPFLVLGGCPCQSCCEPGTESLDDKPGWGGESKHDLEEHETQAQAADLSSQG